MIVDTSAIVALFVHSEPAHARVAEAFSGYEGRLVVSPLVLAEVDYLLATRIGQRAELAALRELSSGAWEIASLTEEDVAEIASVVERYASLEIGATDASLVVLAHRYHTRTVATLDHRHFGALRSMSGEPFDLVPG